MFDQITSNAVREISEMRRENERLRSALERVARWHGEFPPTGKTWPTGEPMSYGAANGSNGERDYMRALAREALGPNAALTGAEGVRVEGIIMQQTRLNGPSGVAVDRGVSRCARTVVRLPVEYEQLLDEACRAASGGDWYWNERFVSALERRGLTLATERPPNDCDAWYPSGSPLQAPHPFHIGPCAWPVGSLVVWKPNAEGEA